MLYLVFAVSAADIGVRAPSDLGGGDGDLLAPTKLHNALIYKSVKMVYERTQIAVKTNTFAILTPNDTVVIPKIESCCPNHEQFVRKISETPVQLWQRILSSWSPSLQYYKIILYNVQHRWYREFDSSHRICEQIVNKKRNY